MKEPTDLPILDHETTDSLREVLESDFIDLVQTLLRDLPLQLETLLQAAASGDTETLYLSAHKLKSGSGSIGAPRLAELARRLEVLGRNERLDGADELLEQISTTADQTRAAFQALLER